MQVYWAFGFPAAIVVVFGADFVMAAGSLFVAKFSPDEDQSVSGAVLQTMMQVRSLRYGLFRHRVLITFCRQLGGAFGLAITTIIFNETLSKQSRKVGIEVDKDGLGAPRAAQESAYRAAMWGGFAFALLGAVLAAVFLSSVGVIGERKPSSKQTVQSPEDPKESAEKA